LSRESTLLIRFTSEGPGLYGPGFVLSTHRRSLQSKTRCECSRVRGQCSAWKMIPGLHRLSWRIEGFRGRFGRVRQRRSPGVGAEVVESRWRARTREEVVMNGVGRKAQMSVVACSSQSSVGASRCMQDGRSMAAFLIPHLILLLTCLHSLRKATLKCSNSKHATLTSKRLDRCGCRE